MTAQTSQELVQKKCLPCEGGVPKFTPREAAESGARYIVLGRAVTAAKSPPEAMKEVLSDLS